MVNYNYLASCDQRDQIGRFIALWATFQSLWQQLFYPNCPHFWAIFMKLSKHFIFLVKSFLGNFFRHLTTFYRSHWSCHTLVVVFLFRSYFCPQLFVLFVKQWQRWWLCGSEDRGSLIKYRGLKMPLNGPLCKCFRHNYTRITTFELNCHRVIWRLGPYRKISLKWSPILLRKLRKAQFERSDWLLKNFQPIRMLQMNAAQFYARKTSIGHRQSWQIHTTKSDTYFDAMWVT